MWFYVKAREERAREAALTVRCMFGRWYTIPYHTTREIIPVLVCAETYKIANRVQLEALVTHNELGAPLANPQEDGREDDKIKKNLTPITLLYDLTPASFVSGTTLS
jgi:hypothetical protein